MKVTNILISQPQAPEKSPYYDLEKKYGVKLTFKPLIHIEELSAKEFREQKIYIPDFKSIVFTSRVAVDHFFSLCQNLRAPISDDLQYFCLSELIANYLQKFINFRKRKVHFSKEGKLTDLAIVMKKHNNGTFLMPVADVHKEDLAIFTKAKVQVTTCVMYRTVSSKIDADELKSYDMLCLFTPAGVQSLFDNCNGNYEQGDQYLALFGPNTQAAAEDRNLRIDIKAPSMETPSMPAALNAFLQNNK